MVHALEKTSELLNSAGILIEVYDLTGPPRIELHTANHTRFVRRIIDSSDFEMLHLADSALDYVVEKGPFKLEKEHIFEYCIQADSLTAFNQWLDELWDTSYLLDESAQLITDTMRDSKGDARVVIRRTARMVRLSPSK